MLQAPSLHNLPPRSGNVFSLRCIALYTHHSFSIALCNQYPFRKLTHKITNPRHDNHSITLFPRQNANSRSAAPIFLRLPTEVRSPLRYSRIPGGPPKIVLQPWSLVIGDCLSYSPSVRLDSLQFNNLYPYFRPFFANVSISTSVFYVSPLAFKKSTPPTTHNQSN